MKEQKWKSTQSQSDKERKRKENNVVYFHQYLGALKILKFRKMKAAGFTFAWKIPESEISWIYFAWGGG